MDADAIISDLIPSFVMMTISPGSISLISLPPTAVIAQLSDDNIYASPAFPRHRGLRPRGSLTPISFWGLMIRRAYPPMSFFEILTAASSMESVFIRSLAILYAMTSESELPANTAPSLSSFDFISSAFITLPLWASASVPLA